MSLPRAPKQAGQCLRVAWFLLLLVANRREESGLAELLPAEARQSKFREREVVTRNRQLARTGT